MLNYIATEATSGLIQKVCEKQNILILYETREITNINTYFKETKANFNLIKYFIVEVNCLDNSEKEIIDNIYNFSRLHPKIRIIVLAQGIPNQNNLLNSLYDNGIYNIINSDDRLEIEEQLTNCLSNEGISKIEAKKFEKVEVVQEKDSKFANAKMKMQSIINRLNKKIRIKNINMNEKIESIHQPNGVCFLICEVLRAIYNVLVFIWTSFGILFLLNAQFRYMIFQILELK